MIFEKPSTRTRVSFEAGIYQLGGKAVVLMGKDTQIGRGEPIKDTARVLSGMVDMVMIRTFEQERIEEFARYSSVPLINGLTDLYHPVQILADYITMIENGIYMSENSFNVANFSLPQKKASPIVAYIGDGNNIAHSWLYMAGILGFELRICTPKSYMPQKEIIDTALEFAKKSGAKIHLISDPKEAIQGSSVVTTDTWVSMGQEEEKQKRLKAFKGFCVDKKLMALAQENAIFLHCLPAYRDYEVSEEVIEGPQSRVWQEAHNRLHIQKGIMVWLHQNR